MAGLQKGNSVAAAQPLAAALAQQQSTSVGRFQITLTNSDFTSGAITSRTASEIYSQLLVDPTPAQWANDPLEALAVIVDPLAPAFDRWFTAALDQVDYDQAMLAADLAKRRRFLATQPLGGRPLALRPRTP